MTERDAALAAIESFAAGGDGRPLFLAIGTFDGVHLGHQAILRRLAADAAAAGAAACVMTFDPHPLAVLRPGEAPPLLTTVADRIALMREQGVERVLVVPFTRAFAAIEPEAFIRDILAGKLAARTVYVGFSFTFGRGGRGTPALLRQVGADQGVTVREFGPVVIDGAVVSSTVIRRALLDGDVETARRGLGRPHRLAGPVIPGQRLGRRLGFPTANLAEGGPVLWPGDGIYAVRARVDGRTYPAVAHLGRRPTVDPHGPRLLEVHLLDFQGDLYGRVLEVCFIKRLRQVARFPDLESLRAQIARDVAEARRALAQDG